MSDESTKIVALFCKNVRFLCREKGKSISEVEKEAGRSVGYLSRAERGAEASLPLSTCCRIAEVLKVRLPVLLDQDLERWARINKLRAEIKAREKELEGLTICESDDWEE
ncbi:MAG: helix-turn-helix transcriptional regulator [Clostridia bacterium]|nr:helix-turn-helix transcriptional regulator [Clostridia bacterium]MBQ9212224.1 helix-turn-helix transcriptional regulator [Clostridia bacterium]